MVYGKRLEFMTIDDLQKRSASVRKSETKSIATTICSEIEESGINANISGISAQGNKPKNFGSSRGRLKKEATIDETDGDEDLKRSKLTEKDISTNVTRSTHEAKGEENPKSLCHQKITDVTFDEEMNVLATQRGIQKNRSLSLGETLSNALTEEMNQNRQSNGEIYWQHKL